MPSNRKLRLLHNSLDLQRGLNDDEAAAAMQRLRGELGNNEPTPAPRLETSDAPSGRNRFGTLSSAERLSCPSAGQLRRQGGSPEPSADDGSGAAAAVGRRQPNRCSKLYDVLLVIDFEATCDENAHDYPNEIIEFPVVALDTKTCRVIAEFHSFVRPVRNPRLTRFCTELTGITQSQVDSAPTLPEVVGNFERWFGDTFNPATKVMVATDGPWDMRDFMYRKSVLRDGISFPPLFFRWINLRKEYASFFKIKPLGVGQMLTRLGLNFEGRQHSGIDDARNIARIAAALISRGCRLNHVSSIDQDGPDATFSEMVRRIENGP